MYNNPIPPPDWNKSKQQEKPKEPCPYAYSQTPYVNANAPGFTLPVNPSFIPSNIPSHSNVPSYSSYPPSSESPLCQERNYPNLYPNIYSSPPGFNPNAQSSSFPQYSSPQYSSQSYPQFSQQQQQQFPQQQTYPLQQQQQFPQEQQQQFSQQQYSQPPPPKYDASQNFSEDTSKDQTPKFHELYKVACSPNGVNQLSSNLKDCEVFMVGGLNEEKHPKYMQCHFDFLRNLGLNVKKVPVDLNSSIEQNAKSIYDYISRERNPNQKAILVGHSKGGTDVLGSLALYPQIQEMLEGVVCLQSPFGGSSIGKEIISSNPVKQLLSATLSKLKIDLKTLENLTHSDRQTFFKEHDLSQVYVPLINLITNNSSKNSLLYPLTEFFKKKTGLENDGLLSSKDAFIPNAFTINLDGVDHSGTMIEDEENKGIGNIIKPTILLLVLLVIVVLLARAYRKRHRGI